MFRDRPGGGSDGVKSMFGMAGGLTALFMPPWAPVTLKAFWVKSRTVILVRTSLLRSFVPDSSVRSLR